MRFASVLGVLLVVGAPSLAQDPAAEWIWDAPNERWVRLADVRRFVSTDAGSALGAGFAGQASERPAAALVEQDVTVAAGTAAARPRVVLNGRLAGLRTVQLAPDVGRGPAQEHTLALISFADGRTALVDLGPTEGLGGVPLVVGAPIVVRAVQGQIDGRPVLMVETLQAHGARREVDWAAGWRAEVTSATPGEAPPAPAPDLSSGAGSQMVVRGRIAGVSEQELGGQRRRTAEVTTDDGRRVTILLGPEASGTPLQPGARVIVRGRWARLGGQRALTVDGLSREQGERSSTR